VTVHFIIVTKSLYYRLMVTATFEIVIPVLRHKYRDCFQKVSIRLYFGIHNMNNEWTFKYCINILLSSKQWFLRLFSIILSIIIVSFSMCECYIWKSHSWIRYYNVWWKKYDLILLHKCLNCIFILHNIYM